MVDLTSTQARAKEVVPPASREGGQAEATTAKPPSASPSLTTDGWTRCTTNWRRFTHRRRTTSRVFTHHCHRLRSDSTPSLFWARTGQSKPIVTPSMIRLAPSPLLISHPRSRHGSRIGTASPKLAAKLTREASVHWPSAARRAHGKVDVATSSGTRSRSRVALL
jgi:hypothetical protein